jgi:hypothetical protein
MRKIVIAAVAALSLTACGVGMDTQAAQQAVGAQDPAADVQAKTDLQTAMVAAQQAYMSDGSYSGVTPAALAQVEPSLSYVSGASTGPNVVSVTSSASGMSAAVLSTSGSCFYAMASAGHGTAMGSGKGSCSAGSAAQYVAQTG